MDAVRRQYLNDEKLRISQATHDQYNVPPVDFYSWLVNLLPLKGDEAILDLGCGTGSYYVPLRTNFPKIRYLGGDLSHGILKKHPNKKTIAQFEAGHLPYPNASFDVVMANFVLYLVDDLETTLAEIRRVLKPNGVLVAGTHSIHTMAEFQVLFRRAIVLLSQPGNTGAAQAPTQIHQPFALENGSRLLSRKYYAVVRHDLPGTLVFPAVEPVMAYLESTRLLREPLLPAGVAWEDVMLIIRQQVGHLLNHFGELVVNKVSGVLMASDNGGFIQPYTELLHRQHPDIVLHR
jgi:SAM-dependent methyltransferase